MCFFATIQPRRCDELAAAADRVPQLEQQVEELQAQLSDREEGMSELQVRGLVCRGCVLGCYCEEAISQLNVRGG